MKYSVLAIPKFQKDLKKLSKKYPSLKKEYLKLVNDLSLNPEIGKYIGNNCYKIRLSISSKGKGKSGGARVITYIRYYNETVYLLTIFDKAETENISDKEIKDILKIIP